MSTQIYNFSVSPHGGGLRALRVIPRGRENGWIFLFLALIFNDKFDNVIILTKDNDPRVYPTRRRCKRQIRHAV